MRELTIRQPQVLKPKEIRNVRTTLGLSQTDFATDCLVGQYQDTLLGAPRQSGA
jgi:DNA-binding transcriptional regulator YiaG